MAGSRIFPAIIVCICVLVPSTLYCLGVQIYLLTTNGLDGKIRTNSALLLTTAIMTAVFLGTWSMARTTPGLRTPPPAGKKVAFLFCLTSTVFWLASLWTGIDVAKQQPVCRNGAFVSMGETPMPWSNGLPCRLHRAAVVFSALGFVSALVILGSMVEISDRPFGGVSNRQKEADNEEKDDQQPEVVDIDPPRDSLSDDGRTSYSEIGIPRSAKGRGKSRVSSRS
ncbi:hypothetical protein EDC01DRAFT_667296 [Geopyxis carbonaria]|nr:hypothetical protein EDC01DRAFT_667296 [Geopyxis carbonaria]